MTVLDPTVTDRTLFAGGTEFGGVGPYEISRSRVTVGLDPNSRADRAVVDLGSARRSASGYVEAQSDVVVLKPVEGRRGNRCLLCVVPNRGTTGGMPFDLDEPPRFGTEPGVHPGDGWLLRAGWTLSWAGWQWDIPREEGRLGCSVPEVVDAEGVPLEGTVRVELQPFLVAAPSLPLRSASDLTGTVTCYPAADVEQRGAALQVAPRRGQPFVPVARTDWRFARVGPGGALVPDPESIWLAGDFQPDLVYEVRYRTNRCPLVGAGLAAFRDAASHVLANDDHLDRAFAVGWSQGGRFLRQFLMDGFNRDEKGRQVFAAVMPFIAGASRGEFNRRFGQPSEALAEGSSLRPPFTLAGLSAVDRARGTLPKVVTVNTASEYWRGDGSLGHIDPEGHDITEDDPDGRAYYFAGTEHLGGVPVDLGAPGPPRNHLSVPPLSRAVLELTRKWVVDGDTPPPSRLPRRGDGTAIVREQAGDQFAAITGLAPSDEGVMLGGAGLRSNTTSDGPRATGPVYVSALDHDGNEVAGVRHPELAVPLATHTGWNLLHLEGPQWTAFSSVTGNSFPFIQEARPTARDGDHRRSVSERYRDLDDYLTQLETAAAALAAEGFLLAEDVESVLATGRAHYELIVGPPAGA